MAKKKDKEKIYRSLLISAGIVILILVVLFWGKPYLLKNQEELTMPKDQNQQPKKTSEGAGEEYPHNLIQGVISEIDSSDPTKFVLEADTSKIATAKLPSMEKTIKLTENTKLVVYDMSTKKESPLKFSELEKGDPVVVGTEESTYEKVNELEEFTATKISKYVNYPGE
ncbi:hypothetical protein KJA17_01035 [Patescibacteria group bacterium]|nr:hypothetical protein [Patescibacteria group bacterium]